MQKRRERHNNDETRSQSQYSIGRSSVNTTHTAQLGKRVTDLMAKYGTEIDPATFAQQSYDAGAMNFKDKDYVNATNNLNTALIIYRELQVHSEDQDEDMYEPTIAEILKILGKVYLARSELEKARKHFNEALTTKQEIYGITVINIDIAELERYLGLTYLTETSSTTDLTTSLTHFANALGYFKVYYGDDTDNVEIADTYYHLGCVYQQQQECDKARAQFTAALTMYQEIFPDPCPYQVKIAEAFYKIGLTYLAVSNYNKAISSFTNAFDIYTETLQTNATNDPNYIDLSFHLGKAYFEIGDVASAKQHVENAWFMYQARYRTSNPDHPSIKAAELALTAIEQKRAELSSEGPGHKSTVTDQRSQRIPAADNPLTRAPTHNASASAVGLFAPKIAATTERIFTKAELQTYYLSQASRLFNASASIFKTDTTKEGVIEELKTRARKTGSGGASGKTLTHFGLTW